jgi:amino acid transporter/nucleotide-binding universal stress UspA family protein
MLYGDWGTSRFYVLGIALALSLHASFFYVLAIGMLVAAVGWAYTIICRCYPDGGGVYSAARHTSKNLAVVGALLLFADYIVTAGMSAYDGIRYMGMQKEYVPYVAMGAIFLVGIINYIGPKKAGTVALVITLATLALTAVLTVFSVPHMAAGWTAVKAPTQPLTVQWAHFVGVVLALSGVEAIANMTGIMVPPVSKTANKAIWPVLVEVVLLNIVLAVAMNGLPKAGYDLGEAPANVYEKVERIRAADGAADVINAAVWTPGAAAQAELAALSKDENIPVAKLQTLVRDEELKKHQEDTTDAVLRVMATVYVHPWFGWICGFVFGALLLSAVNTAVADMVSIQYVMSRDTELPHVLTKLNKFGVPWLALIGAVGLPVAILSICQNINDLASLYAVGVVGAVAINLGSCSINKEMPVRKWERVGLIVLAVIMAFIEATLVWDKPDARYFALFVLCSGLAARFFTKTYPHLSFQNRGASLAAWAVLLVTAAGIVLHFESDISVVLHEKVVLFKAAQSAHFFTYIVSSLLLMCGGTSATYGVRYLMGKGPVLAAAPGFPALDTAGATMPAAMELDVNQPHVLVATRGGRRLLEFAANYCHKTHASMYVLFVRQVNVVMTGGGDGARAHRVEEDQEAVKAFAQAAEICQKAGVPMMPMYVVSPDVAYTILDFSATYGVEAVLMGVSRVGTLLRALRGDVISAVADNLPEDISLLIHA